MGWAALGGMALQGGGSYTSGEAAKRDAAHQASLMGNYQNAYGQYTGWQNDADAALAGRMHDLSQQGYQNYQNLGQALGGQQRMAAGQAGASASDARLRAAMSGTPTIGAPKNVPSSGYGGWAANTTAQRYTPQLQAQTALINQQAAQRGMTNYDRGALGQAADTTVDLGRQSAEAQQKENALAAYRQQLLEQAAVKFQYQGPNRGYYNAQLYSQGLNLAGQGLMAYGSSQNANQPGGYSNSPYATNRLQGPSQGP